MIVLLNRTNCLSDIRLVSLLDFTNLGLTLFASSADEAGMSNLFANWDAARMTSLNEVFDVALQDSNGDKVYNSTKVHMGHLDPKKNMLVARKVWERANSIRGYSVDLEVFGKINGHLSYLGNNGLSYQRSTPYLFKIRDNSTTSEDLDSFWHMVVMNYNQLVTSGVDTRASAYAALFRARWAFTGALAFLAKSKVDPASEITIVEDNDKTYGAMLKVQGYKTIFENAGCDVTGLLEVALSKNGGMTWVVQHAENLWAAVEHTFRVRSHHFKTTGEDGAAYKKLYETFMNACYEGKFEVPEGFDWFTIAHTAIHPFKIEALPKATAHYLCHGLIADAASVRFSGAPVGNAVLTTTNAAMSTMASEIWYSAFKSIYKGELDELAKVTNQICDDKYSFHIAAGLYGVPKKETVDMFGAKVTTSDARTRLSVLGAAAAGLIDALAEAKETIDNFEFALSNAKALRKASSNNPLMNLKVRELILRAVSEVTDADNLPKAIEASLPGAASLLGSSSTAIVAQPSGKPP